MDIKKQIASAKAKALTEQSYSQHRSQAILIEQALIEAGEKKEATFDINNPFDRPEEAIMSFSLRGYAEYLSISGNKYEAVPKLQPGSMEYKVLHALVSNPRKLMTAKDICIEIGQPEKYTDKVRFWINDLRKRFKLTNKNPDNCFIATNKSCKINCISKITD